MYLGIDLGTSNSAVVSVDDGGVRLFKTSDGKDVLASVLYFDRSGRMSVGTRAYAQLEISPDKVAHGFKRLMGTSSTIELEGANKSLTPEQASAEIIRELLRQVEAETGARDVAGAIITIPAAFDQMQSEATIRAAHEAGLSKVGLLQEPVAAAMAALEGATRRDGRFLIYDLGGGTFDLALVEASGGTVNVIAHEGIKMLGGRDFDRTIVDSIIRPWLNSNFSLPENLAADARYKRLLAVMRNKGELAKIELSTRDQAAIYLSEDDARADDLDGKPIYVEVEISRAKYEELIKDRIFETIELSKKILKDNGLTNEDVDRVVFIGGPSKTPVIRDMVSRELGIPADHKTDPMTAVARGAAIFSESRDWSVEKGQKKSARGAVSTTGDFKARVVFTARSADDRARLRVEAETASGDYKFKVVGPEGYDSGWMPLDEKASITVPLNKPGRHIFTVQIEDESGQRACEDQIVEITRTEASAAAIHATRTVSVKVAEGPASERRNVLAPLIKKGTPLPVKGTDVFRLREKITGGTPNRFDVELFNQADDVNDPELNLAIGVFRVLADDILESGEVAEAGTSVHIHWEMDDSGLITCSVSMPDLGVTLAHKSFYNPQVGQDRFDGEEGATLAESKLIDAEEAIVEARAAMGREPKLDLLQRRLARQRELLANSSDAEARRSITEEALHVQQELARLKEAPEHQRAVLLQEIERIEDGISDLIESMDPGTVERLSTLLRSAREEISNKNWSGVRQLVQQARTVFQRSLYEHPAFLLAMFERLSQERHSALDKDLHDRLVQQGWAAVEQQDIDSVREVLSMIVRNRMPNETESSGVTMLAGLMR
jgi:molecular chaperone DnaK